MRGTEKKLESILAERLRELALERDLPLTHLADRAGLARSYLWKLLDAESSATLEVLQRLADALEVSPLELLIAARTYSTAKPLLAAEATVRSTGKPGVRPRRR